MQKQEEKSAFRKLDETADRWLSKQLLPLFLSIVVMIALLCGSTFAWFYVQSPSWRVTLTAGNAAVLLSVNGAENPETEITLQNQTEYTLTVTQIGEVQYAYAVIQIGSDSYLIPTLPASVILHTSAEVSVPVRVKPYWGTNQPSLTVLPAELTIPAPQEVNGGT